MQNVSSSNSQAVNVPKLRFPGFEEEWKELSFADTFDFLTNNTLSRAELSSEGEIKNIHYGDILVKFGDVLDCSFEQVPYIGKNAKIGNKITFLKDGDVIIADTAEDETVGKATEIVNVSTPVVSGLHTMACRPKFRFEPRYLGYYINSSCYHNQLFPFMQGVKVTSVSKGNIALTHIRYPSGQEQQKISSMLAIIDNRIEKQQALVDALKLYKRGVSNKLLFKNTSNFKKVKIKDFSTAYGGYAFDSKSYENNGKYKIITIGNVSGERYINGEMNTINHIPIDIQEFQKLKPYDIVISMTGNVGRVSYINEIDCLMNQRVAKIEISDEVLREYIYQILSTKKFENSMINLGQGAAQKNIKNQHIENFELYMPETEKTTKAISNCLKYMDLLILQNEKKLSSIKTIKEALLQQMFI